VRAAASRPDRLHGALRGRGLIRADDALRAEAAVGAVSGIAYDSRTVTPGQVFVALKGLHADGTSFARQAIERGAAAVVSEEAAPDGIRVPWAIVEDARLAIAVLAAAFYRDPSREMRVIGITGTNGKTTTAFLLASIFDAARIPCGILGTVGYRIGDEVREATRTTPEAPEVQALLREMVDRKCGACAMEVSSHALSLRRVDGITFAAGVFTNLTRDHLDFHADMDGYFRAKRRLFEMLPRDAPSLVNLDDPRGAALVDAGGRPVTYAITRPADVTPGPLSFSLDGLSFDVRTPRGTLHVTSRLVGRPNVYNILLDRDRARRAVRRDRTRPHVAGRRARTISGRLRRQGRSHRRRRLRAYRRCTAEPAGDRAPARAGPADHRIRLRRRSRSHEAPADGGRCRRLSDLIVITSDNPRSGDPNRIIEEVRRASRPTRAVTRRSAC
jgi:UDP-N-acetylmuramoyl-L-alanyl-D-glutamate--2,6-diaminopimelate ligase